MRSLRSLILAVSAVFLPIEPRAEKVRGGETPQTAPFPGPHPTPAPLSSPASSGCFGNLSESPATANDCRRPKKIPLPKGSGPHAISGAPFRKPGQPRFIGTPGVSSLGVPRIQTQSPPAKPHTRKRVRAQSSPAQQAIEGTVINSSFKLLSPTRGEWRGAVSGRGNAEVILALLQNGAPFELRSIGSVELEERRAIPFVFRSAVPNTSGWEWNILLRDAGSSK